MSHLARGSLAGIIGTSMMDAVRYLRYRRSGGRSSLRRWEFSLTSGSWDNAPAPARVANLIAKRLTGKDIPIRHAGLANDLMHWGYGTSMGALYGLLLGDRHGVVRSGILWGAAVWTSSYVLLPITGIYRPIWRYDARTLEQDLSAHLIFGLSTATAFARSRELSAQRLARAIVVGGAVALLRPTRDSHEAEPGQHESN